MGQDQRAVWKQPAQMRRHSCTRPAVNERLRGDLDIDGSRLSGSVLHECKATPAHLGLLNPDERLQEGRRFRQAGGITYLGTGAIMMPFEKRRGDAQRIRNLGEGLLSPDWKPLRVLLSVSVQEGIGSRCPFWGIRVGTGHHNPYCGFLKPSVFKHKPPCKRHARPSSSIVHQCLAVDPVPPGNEKGAPDRRAATGALAI